MNNPNKQIELRGDSDLPNVSITDGEVKIRMGREELLGKGEVEVAILDVDNEEGFTARFWISVEVENGRPKVKVTTKPYSGARRGEEVSTRIAGSCNIL